MVNVAFALGRICLPIVFIWSAIQRFFNIGAYANTLASVGVPIPDEIAAYLGSVPKYEALAYLLAGVELACGLMIVLGLKARWGALVLVVFTAATIFYVHHFWDMADPDYTLHQTHALKNLSILGGLLLLVAVGSGPHSIDRRQPA